MRCGVAEQHILVIGYGNPLRRDDGIGPRVAEAIAAANYPSVHVRPVRQLVPELVADIAEARMVVFVDALADPSRTTVELMPLHDAEITDWSTHTAHPRALLALTRAIYQRVPEAWWLTVPARDFDFGEGFSSVAAEGVRQAIALFNKLIQTRSLPFTRAEFFARGTTMS
jgi:hydrogenase maturation protease